MKGRGTMDEEKKRSSDISVLISLIHTLRGPQGCPWDRQQHFRDLGRYLLEETYELIEAVEEGSPDSIREELGDILFLVLFMVVVAEQEGVFDLATVVTEETEKMIRRHPHVFGHGQTDSVEDVKAKWEEIKCKVENRGEEKRGILWGCPRALPSLSRAREIQRRAAAVGFDWPDVEGVMAKIEEEWGELREAVEKGDTGRMMDELGDCLFSFANLSRFIGVDAEGALTKSIDKFIHRFTYVEERLQREGVDISSLSLPDMERLWEEAKGEE